MNATFESKVRNATVAACIVFGVALLYLVAGHYIVGILILPVLLAPFVVIERAIARIRAADLRRPSIVPLIYAHLLGVFTLLSRVPTRVLSRSDAIGTGEAIAGIVVAVLLSGSWLIVALYGAFGRRFRPLLALLAVGFIVIGIAIEVGATEDWRRACGNYRAWGVVALLDELSAGAILHGLVMLVVGCLTMLQWMAEARLARAVDGNP